MHTKEMLAILPTMVLRTKGIIVLIVILALAGVLISLKTVKHELQPLWKDFIWNGDALRFSYPSKFCFSADDCRKLYVVHHDDAFLIGSMQKEQPGSNSAFIDPILIISYVDGVELQEAAQYLRDTYIQQMEERNPTFHIGAIQWTADAANASVKVPDLKNSWIYAAYSEQMHTLVAFQLQPACLFDCQIDQDVLHSITFDGVQVYSGNEIITLPVEE
jgi:hypothetical protein